MLRDRSHLMIEVREERSWVSLYAHAQRCGGCWIRTENIDSEIGSRFLPGGVVMSKEEKGRTLALSLTHRVGDVVTASKWMSPARMKDPMKIPMNKH